MFRTRCAEYLLRRFVGTERAEEIVGDLLESHGSSSQVGFWVALLRVMLRFAWRPMTALLVAAVVWVAVDAKLFFATAERFGSGAPRDISLLLRSMRFVHQSASLSALAAFAFLRYGVRDRSSWLGALYAGLCILWVYSFWMPWTRIELYVGCALVALISLSARELRRSSVVVVSSLISWIAASWVLSSLFTLLFSLATTRRHLIGHVWIAGVLTEAVPLVLASLAFGLLHRRLCAIHRDETFPAAG